MREEGWRDERRTRGRGVGERRKKVGRKGGMDRER